MACSPCIVAEWAQASSQNWDMEAAHEAEAEDFEAFDKEIMELGAEFDLDDDACWTYFLKLLLHDRRVSSLWWFRWR